MGVEITGIEELNTGRENIAPFSTPEKEEKGIEITGLEALSTPAQGRESGIEVSDLATDTAIPAPTVDKEEPDSGLFETIRDYAKLNWLSAKRTYKGLQAQEDIELLRLMHGRDEVPQTPPTIARLELAGKDRVKQHLRDTLGDIKQIDSDIAELPIAEESREFLSAANNADKLWEVFKKAPLEITAQFAATNAWQMVPMLGAGIAGAMLGRLGFMGAIGATSSLIETGNDVLDAMEAVGVDTRDPEEMAVALTDPEIAREVLSTAREKGAVVGLFDGLTAGLSTKTIAPEVRSALARELANLFSQTMIQAAGGAAGEALGAWASGINTSLASIVAEGLGEIGSAPADVVSATLTGLRDDVKASIADSRSGGVLRNKQKREAKKKLDEVANVKREDEGTQVVFSDSVYTELDDDYFALQDKMRELDKRIREIAGSEEDVKLQTHLALDALIGDHKKVEEVKKASDLTFFQGELYDDYLHAFRTPQLLTNAVTVDENGNAIELDDEQARAIRAAKTADELPGNVVALYNENAFATSPLFAQLTDREIVWLAYRNDLITLDQAHEVVHGGELPREARNAARDMVLKVYKNFYRNAAKIVADLQKKFGLEKYKIIIRDATERIGGMPSMTNGTAGVYKDANGNIVLAMTINPNMILRDVRSRTWPQDARKEKLSSTRVIYHEFGHLMVNAALREMHQDPHLRRALDAAYAEYLSKLAEETGGLDKDGSLRKYKMRYYAPPTAQESAAEGDVRPFTKAWVANNMPYFLGQVEFVAEYFARSQIANNYHVDKKLRKRLEGIKRSLKELYGLLGEDIELNEPFELFLRKVMLGRDLTNARVRLTNKMLARALEEKKRAILNNDEVAREYWEERVKVFKDALKNLTEQRVAKSEPKSSLDLGKKSELEDISESVDQALSDSVVTFSQGMAKALTLLQIAKKNPHIEPLQRYVEKVRAWWADKMPIVAQANDNISVWLKLPHNEREGLADALLEITVESSKKERRLTNDEEMEILRKHISSDDAFMVYDAISEQMEEILADLELLDYEAARRAYADDDARRNEAFEQIRQQYEELKNRNYFPLSRFGEYTIYGLVQKPFEHEGKEYKANDVFLFETFESQHERDAAWKELKKTFGDKVNFGRGKLSEAERNFAHFPPWVIDKMRTLIPDTPEAEQEFNDMIYRLAPISSFKKRLIQRKLVKGWSTDAMRGYADYVMRSANFIARERHRWEMEEAIRDLHKSARDAQDRGEKVDQVVNLANYLTRHFDYIMNPEREWENLRAFGFLWYLGANIKSAFVNSTQVPIVTFSALAARYGDKNAVAAIMKAMKITKNVLLDPKKVDRELLDAVEMGIEQGILNESLATELAAVQEGNKIAEMLVGGSARDVKVYLRRFAGMAAMPFQFVEKLNRYITFIAAYNLAKESDATLGFDELYAYARDIVETTQFEYARWNRPEFMRGKLKSTIFLFYQYVQNILFFAFGGDPGWWRWWLMMMFAAGLQSLPFVENIEDIINAALKYFGGKAKWDNPEADVRLMLRRVINEIGVNPDLVMHGVTRYAFGIPQVLAGASPGFAGFDISGTLSLGRIVPGTEVLASTKDGADRILDLATDVGGAFYSIPISVMQAALDENPDAAARWIRALPSALRGVAQAVQAYSKEGIYDRAGSEILPLDTSDPRNLAEIFGQALGFTPTRWKVEKEKRWAILQTVRYWEGKRRYLLARLDYARREGDNAEVSKVLKDIDRFNSARPDWVPGISGRDANRSLKQRGRGRQRQEITGTRNRRYQGVAEEIKKLY